MQRSAPFTESKFWENENYIIQHSHVTYFVTWSPLQLSDTVYQPIFTANANLLVSETLRVNVAFICFSLKLYVGRDDLNESMMEFLSMNIKLTHKISSVEMRRASNLKRRQKRALPSKKAH